MCIGEKLFIDETFAYGDYNYLGPMLWNCGYPVVTAKHYKSGTFDRMRGTKWYLFVRNRIALNTSTKTSLIYFFLEGFITPTIVKRKVERIPPSITRWVKAQQEAEEKNRDHRYLQSATDISKYR